MKAEREIEKKIKQKEEDIRHLQESVRHLQSEVIKAQAYVEAMRESLRLISKSSATDAVDTVRPGSLVDKARTAIRKAGQPLHVEKILPQIGKDLSKENKVSLSGSLAFYVRKGIIFTRPAPNTFGLVEFEKPQGDGPPDGFGKDN